jgi:hypothetical protein
MGARLGRHVGDDLRRLGAVRGASVLSAAGSVGAAATAAIL